MSIGVVLGAAVAAVQFGCAKGNSGAPPEAPPVQVVVVEAKRKPVVDRLSGVVGTLAANEMVEVKSETEGTVREILFQEGQPVKAGDLLIQLDDRKLKAALAEAEANYSLSKANLERSKQLFEDRLVSQQEFDQAASAFALNEASVALRKQQLEESRIIAPFEGVAGSRNVSPGQVISRNTTLTWLIDLDPVKVEFNIPERYLSKVRVGQTIEVTVDAYPDREFVGTVYFVSPYVDETFRTFLIKATIPNPEGQLKPGMFANLDLNLTVRESAVVVPEAALAQMMQEDRANVFVVESNHTVRVQPVQLGFFMPGQVEIVSGLQGGEWVIVEGVQKVAPGSKVKLAPPEAALPYQFDESPSGVKRVSG